ncbi:MAG TPA: molybdate ABC transporter substrate-binding protein [Pseudogracilibacillus sp.]|nr:molybdate ABC transporter substrate-binding protein [Pseudogracilibacillus sp.]
MRKCTVYTITIVLFLLVSCSGVVDESADDTSRKLTVGAAVSLVDVLEEVKEQFEQTYDVEVTFTLGSSGKIAQQIERGAPIDLFISANDDWIDYLAERDEIDTTSRATIATNKLALITHENSGLTYDSFQAIDATHINYLALGEPTSVPAGKYSKALLQSLGKWETLEEKIVYAQDVRQVVTFVASENATLGIVYASDATASNDVLTLATSDAKTDDIAYEAAVIQHRPNEEQARLFLEFLLREETEQFFLKHGFSQKD